MKKKKRIVQYIFHQDRHLTCADTNTKNSKTVVWYS